MNNKPPRKRSRARAAGVALTSKPTRRPNNVQRVAEGPSRRGKRRVSVRRSEASVSELDGQSTRGEKGLGRTRKESKRRTAPNIGKNSPQKKQKAPVLLKELISRNLGLTNKCQKLQTRIEAKNEEIETLSNIQSKYLNFDVSSIPSLSQKQWLMMHKMQISEILRLKKENYRLELGQDLNQGTSSIIRDLVQKIDNLEDLLKEDPILHIEVESLTSKNLELTQKMTSIFEIFKSKISGSLDSLEIQNQQDRDNNSRNWDPNQNHHTARQWDVALLEITEQHLEYTGYLAQKLDILENLVSDTKHNGPAIKNLKGLILEEASVAISKSQSLIKIGPSKAKASQIRKALQKKDNNNITTNCSGSNSKSKNLFSEIQSKIEAILPKITSNIDNLHSKGDTPSQTFLETFFFKEKNSTFSDPDHTIASLILKIQACEYLSSIKLMQGKITSIVKHNTQFVHEFEALVSDPIYQLFNLIDSVDLPPGLEPAFASLKVRIVKTLESFLRQDARSLDYKTVVSLQALEDIAKLGKKYLGQLEESTLQQKLLSNLFIYLHFQSIIPLLVKIPLIQIHLQNLLQSIGPLPHPRIVLLPCKIVGHLPQMRVHFQYDEAVVVIPGLPLDPYSVFCSLLEKNDQNLEES